MKSLSESQVRAALQPADVFAEVRRFLAGPVWRSAVAEGREDVAPLAGDPVWRPAVKAGRCGDAVGLRLRPYDEGGYLTLCWDRPAAEPVAVEATWLTYMRTAAILLLGPWFDSQPDEHLVVLGRGRLGIAVLAMALAVLPHARLASWAPSERRRHAAEALGSVQCHSGSEPPEATLAVFATSARGPIPLSEHWIEQSRWLCYGGPSALGRRQLGEACRTRIEWADDPACCAAAGLSEASQPLAQLEGSRRLPSARHVLWACGGGPVDAHLARAAINAHHMSGVSV
jgi:hypothetical protein